MDWAWIKAGIIAILGALVGVIQILFRKREAERDRLIERLQADLEAKRDECRQGWKKVQECRETLIKYRAQRDELRRRLEHHEPEISDEFDESK